jgi:acyl-coenzyme A synthetase/AMP-(fatty) acid ligase
MKIGKKDLINSLKGSLVPYKIPKEIEIMKSLPKNKSGKIMKPLLAKKTKNQE